MARILGGTEVNGELKGLLYSHRDQGPPLVFIPNIEFLKFEAWRIRIGLRGVETEHEIGFATCNTAGSEDSTPVRLMSA